MRLEQPHRIRPQQLMPRERRAQLLAVHLNQSPGERREYTVRLAAMLVCKRVHIVADLLQLREIVGVRQKCVQTRHVQKRAPLVPIIRRRAHARHERCAHRLLC
eukprot:6980529-Prymnesium_polylepis.1